MSRKGSIQESRQQRGWPAMLGALWLVSIGWVITPMALLLSHPFFFLKGGVCWAAQQCSWSASYQKLCGDFAVSFHPQLFLFLLIWAVVGLGTSEIQCATSTNTFTSSPLHLSLPLKYGKVPYWLGGPLCGSSRTPLIFSQVWMRGFGILLGFTCTLSFPWQCPWTLFARTQVFILSFAREKLGIFQTIKSWLLFCLTVLFLIYFPSLTLYYNQ